MRHSAGEAPLLVVASLAGGDDVDATTVSFLLRKTLVLKKTEEEEKERRRKLEEEEKEQFLEQSMQELRLLSETPLAGRSLQQTKRMMELLNLRVAASSSSSKRKRKRRRKRRTPRTSSRPLRGRARRRQRQWHLQCWFCWYFTSRCFPSCCRLAPDARHHGRYAPKGQLCALRFRQWHAQGSFCKYFAPRAVFLPWFSGPRALSAGPPLGLRLIPMVLLTMVIPQPHFLTEVIGVPGMQVVQVVCPLCATTGALRSCSSSTRSFTPCRGAVFVPHGSLIQQTIQIHLLPYTRCSMSLLWTFMCSKFRKFRSCSSSTRDFTSLSWRFGFLPWSRLCCGPFRFPSRSSTRWSLPLFAGRRFIGRAGRRHSCRDTEADPHGVADHRDSPVARGHVVDAPFCAGRASRASLTGAGCEDHSRDPTVAAH